MLFSRLKVYVTPVLLTAALAGCGGQEESGGGDDDRKGVAIAAHEVSLRELSRPLSVSGVVEARRYVRIHARTSGNLEQLTLEAGDPVSAGEQLAALDMTEQRAEEARARALREEAQLSYNRARELHERNNLSAAEYQQARASLKVAESEAELWEARVGFGSIRSPMDGVVIGRYVEPGEHVQVQDMLFKVSDMSSLVVRLPVSELDVGHLAPGREIPLRIDALPDGELTGWIRRIAPSADADSRRVAVEISLPEDAYEQGVRPGYLVRVSIRIDRREDVLAVPTLAVGTEGTGDEGPFVYRIRGDKLERQPVTEGMRRGQWTEITEGLAPGDLILATNPRDRSDGEKIRIVEQRD